MIEIPLNLLRFVLRPRIWSVLEDIPWAFEKNIQSIVGRNILYMSGPVGVKFIYILAEFV